jgi:MFS family permease
MLFAARYLGESRDMAEAKKMTPARGRSREAVRFVVSHPRDMSSRLIWIYAVTMGAFQGVTAILTLFMAIRFGLTEKTIGFVFLFIGLIAVVTRAVILGPAVDKFGEARLSRFGLFLLASGIAVLPFMHKLEAPGAIAHAIDSITPGDGSKLLAFLPLAFPVALIPLGTAFTFPCVTALLSRVVPAHERGLYMGVQQTFGGLARVLFPVLAGLAFDWYLQLPFLVSALLVASMMFYAMGLERIEDRTPVPTAKPDPTPGSVPT